MGAVLVAAGYTGYWHVQLARVGRLEQGLADGPATNDAYRLSHDLISSAFYLADKMLTFRWSRFPRLRVCPHLLFVCRFINGQIPKPEFPKS